MIIFIDETGDLGFDFTKAGTSAYFVITALALANHQNRRALEKAVERTIKNKLHVGKRGKKRPAHELKGRRTAPEVKAYFWRQVQKIPFDLYAIALNKNRVYQHLRERKDRLYNYVARLLIDHIPVDGAHGALHVEIDKSKSRSERDDFNTYLESHIKGRLPPGVPLWINHMPSEQSKGVQAADMFSWGVARRHEHNGTAWYDLYRGRMKWETVFLPRLDG